MGSLDRGRLTQSQLDTLKKILVIQLGPFGDALLCAVCFEWLRKRIPQARLCYLLKEPYDEVVRQHPFIDEVVLERRKSGLGYVLERLRTILRIRKGNYDLVIDQQSKPSSEQLTLLSGAKYRLGFGDTRFSWVYNIKAERGPGRYTGAKKLDILEALGIEGEPYHLFFAIDEESHRFASSWLESQGLNSEDVVLVSPGSPVRKKKWKAENYAKLADLMQTRTAMRVVLLWGPGELGDVATVQAKMRTGPVIAPPTDLRQAAALLKRCRLLVCNDGGLNHIAVTTETPTLAIFGNTDPAAWSPASEFPHHHHLYNPDFDSMNDDSFGISAEEAFEKVTEILGSVRRYEHDGKSGRHS
jgi:ADP-heptose:LPS heptosyltransferase